MLDGISYNVADAIPYKSFKEKNSLVNQELSKDRFVEVWDELKVVYSAEKWEE